MKRRVIGYPSRPIVHPAVSTPTSYPLELYTFRTRRDATNLYLGAIDEVVSVVSTEDFRLTIGVKNNGVAPVGPVPMRIEFAILVAVGFVTVGDLAHIEVQMSSSGFINNEGDTVQDITTGVFATPNSGMGETFFGAGTVEMGNVVLETAVIPAGGVVEADICVRPNDPLVFNGDLIYFRLTPVNGFDILHTIQPRVIISKGGTNRPGGGGYN